MIRRACILLCVAVTILFLSGCGQTYELQSITVSTTLNGAEEGINIEGPTSQALVVTAHYSNTKTEDVTVHSTFQLGASADAQAPLTSVSVNNSGIVQVVASACTWTATANGTGYTYTSQPYVVTVSYAGFTAVQDISVDNEAACYDGIGYPHP